MAGPYSSEKVLRVHTNQASYKVEIILDSLKLPAAQLSAKSPNAVKVVL